MKRLNHKNLDEYIKATETKNVKAKKILKNIWDINIKEIKYKNKVEYLDDIKEFILKLTFKSKYVEFDFLKVALRPIISERVLASLLIDLSYINDKKVLDFEFRNKARQQKFHFILKNDENKEDNISNIIDTINNIKEEINIKIKYEKDRLLKPVIIKKGQEKATILLKLAAKLREMNKKNIVIDVISVPEAIITPFTIMNNNTIITLTPYILKQIYGDSKDTCKSEEPPKSLDEFNSNKMRFIKIADNIIDAVLNRLETVWISLSDVEKKDYINSLFIRYFTLEEFLKLDTSEKEEYLLKLGFNQKDVNTYKNRTDFTELMKTKFVNSVLKSKNHELILGSEYFIDFKNKFCEWKNLSEVEKMDYIYNLFIRYFTLEEFLKLDTLDRKEYLFKLDFNEKDIETYKNCSSFTELMKNKFVKAVLKSKNNDLILGNKHFIDFKNSFNNSKEVNKKYEYKRLKYSLLFDLIEQDKKKFNYLKLIENTIRGIEYDKEGKPIKIQTENIIENAICHNFLDDTNENMLRTLRSYLLILRKQNNVIDKDASCISLEFELMRLSNNLKDLGGVRSGLIKKLNTLDKKKKENSLNQNDYDMIKILNDDLKKLDTRISDKRKEYIELGAKYKYHDSKAEENKEINDDSNNIMTLENLGKNKVFIEKIAKGTKGDKTILVIYFAIFDSSKNKITAKSIRKRVFGAVDWAILLELSGVQVDIRINLYLYEKNKAINYKDKYKYKLAIDEIKKMRKPDEFKSYCLYEYNESINETLNRLAEEIKMLKG